MSAAICSSMLSLSLNIKSAKSASFSSRSVSSCKIASPVTFRTLENKYDRSDAFTIEAATKAKSKNKMKTRSSAKKRFKVTATGKVMYRHGGKQHLNGKMKPLHKKRLTKEASLDDGHYEHAKRLLPYAKTQRPSKTKALKEAALKAKAEAAEATVA